VGDHPHITVTDVWDSVKARLNPPPPPAAWESPINFAEACSHGAYHRARHLELVEATCLDAIANGKRIIISISVRHGKSRTVSEWLPAWYLGRNPDNRVILAGHEADFAARWGRAARDILTEHGPDIFGVSVSRRSEAANRWDIEGHNGGMLTVGVGGSPIGRGADLCIASGTLVSTPQGDKDIAVLANEGGILWAYDHDRERVVEASITAATESETRDLVEIEFRSGRRLRCTPDHRIALEGGRYIEARLVSEGTQVPALGDPDLPDLRKRVPTRRKRARQEASSRTDGDLLLTDLRQRALQGDAPMREVLETDGQKGSSVLPRLHLGPSERNQIHPRRNALPAVLDLVPPPHIEADLLQSWMCQSSPLRSNDRFGKLALQGRHQLRTLVQVDATPDPRTGRQLRRVWQHGTDDRAPHRRGSSEQHPGEPGDALQDAPHGAPQVGLDTVVVVRHLRPASHVVYDLTVEGPHNFFAGEVLVHNCIIDDPVKSYADAMSPLVRKRVQDWWTGTMVSRIEPGGAAILVMARWHADDLAGFLLKEDPENWSEIRLPAVCDSLDDPLGRELGEPLWPERFPLAELERRKHETSLSLGESVWLAQYQQTPRAPSGDIFVTSKWRYGVPADVPAGTRWCRGWDLAATDGAGDYTAHVHIGRSPDGRTFIADAGRGQWASDRVRSELLDVARRDGPSTMVELPQDPGQAGKDQAAQLTRLLSGFQVRAIPQTGTKEVRAAGLAAQQQAGNVTLIGPESGGSWVGDLIGEFEEFPRGAHDDQVDAAAVAFNRLIGAGATGQTKAKDRRLKGRR
jgi:predicted phage terminase large subunit-like protein